MTNTAEFQGTQPSIAHAASLRTTAQKIAFRYGWYLLISERIGSKSPQYLTPHQ